MKLAIILSGTLNTFYQNYLESKYTLFDFLKEIDIDFDVFCCTEPRSFSKKESEELAKQSADKLKLNKEYDRVHVEDKYVVVEETEQSIREKLRQVFDKRIKSILFTKDKQNTTISQRYNEKIYLNLKSIVFSRWF